MTLISVRSMAVTLVMSIMCLAFTQTRAQAMLAPATLAQAANASVASAADLQTIQSTLESKELRAKLHALGLSDEEIQSRMSRLSDAQKHQLASQIRAVNPAGGIIIGVLIFVVLVLLIIYLLKRI